MGTIGSSWLARAQLGRTWLPSEAQQSLAVVAFTMEIERSGKLESCQLVQFVALGSSCTKAAEEWP